MTFDQSFDRLMGNEGGYVNNPADPGGETNWGIAKRSYPNVDIKALTRDGAKAIYLRDFWQRGQMDQIAPELAFHVFDFAVNSGIETAVRKLQAAAGVADDGHIGPFTLAAVKSKSLTDMIMRVTAARLRFMTKLSNWPASGAGWANRIAQNLEYGAQDT